MTVVVAVMTVDQIVTLAPGNVSIVNKMSTAQFTETKSVEAMEGALTRDLKVCQLKCERNAINNIQY